MTKSITAMFRAYDIRGIFATDLTVEVMIRVGQAFGTFLQKQDSKKITVGGDIRASTRILQHAFLAGICSTGISCDVVSESPLGLTLFNSFHQKYTASAFITASHLPPDWNGIKFYWGAGIGFSPEDNSAVQSIFEKNDFIVKDAFSVGDIKFIDPYPEYINYLRSKFEFKQSYKLAIDCGNGATALVIPQLYEDLGFEVLPIYDNPDPRFPNRPSEPTEETLHKLVSIVKSNEVDFGAGFDGDGDRCVFVDEKGNVLSADAFGLIIADYLIKTGDNNKVVINIECSITVEDHLKGLGADVKRIRVGHSFLSLEAQEMGAVLGVEASGHAVVPDIFLFDDALILPLVFAQAIEYFQSPVSKLASQIQLPVKKRFDLKCPDETKFAIVNTISDFLKEQEGEINEMDGVSLTMKEGRILVRVSNTSPKIRVTIESKTEDGFTKIQERYLPTIKNFLETKK
jgi:phosphomannomutase